ncbi:AAA family ATPase [Sphingobacterium sp.]|uniref:AAA family ATPase n=1 Tax=Sphingobacterium sp. TaxID=341027 RepID=UPI002897FDB2|nr:AAA family ATPase [Sphingobacterium sp.]
MTNELNPNDGNQVDLLSSEIKAFAENLPYWSKYLAERILSGQVILEDDIEKSYNWLLEDLGIQNPSERPAISLQIGSSLSGQYINDLKIVRLENIEGVNALMEDQKIDFGDQLTIVYGTNGSGKSGYTRLLKQVFYSKSPEQILQNIHLESGHKPVNAKFTFSSSLGESSYLYAQKSDAVFRQFSVFDGKSVIRHLDQKNEFEFRPAGLAFFADYSEAIIKVEQRINIEQSLKGNGLSSIDLSELFEGDSEIKEFVRSISAKTKAADLDKYVPFSTEEKEEKIDLDKAYDDLYIASRNKEKEIGSLQVVKKILMENREIVVKNNRCFTKEYLEKINLTIRDTLEKEKLAKEEGIEKFETEKILNIGSPEWKNFIISADNFSKLQSGMSYPVLGDNCLLCHQPLSAESINLISDYWLFIKSVAEENAKKAQGILDQLVIGLSKLNYNLFPADNILTSWMLDKYQQQLSEFKKELDDQEALRDSILIHIGNKTEFDLNQFQIRLANYTEIEQKIDESIAILQQNEVLKELANLNIRRSYLSHKEKYNTHYSKFKSLLENQQWLSKAGKANFRKVKTDITYTEKSLSEKYFNQKYIDAFNDECKNLNGNFGIQISHTAAAGKSFRQLKLKGNSPHAVLSEGEQKVIAIADFLAEMKLSEINRGLIFDDPVTSLDEIRKSEIAKRLVEECRGKQTIVFTHDLVFVSSLIGHCSDFAINHVCHWIENRSGYPGQIWLNNAPSYEKSYRSAQPAKEIYDKAKKPDCPPEEREFLLKTGFASLRTSYEVLVINDLFKNVVQRFNERVSIDSLNSVNFDRELVEELQDSFGQCCRYMEGHTHSDRYAYKRPDIINLNEEIQRFEAIKAKIKKFGKTAS